MPPIISFNKILLASALLLAGCGAFFSIFGMVTLFSGAAISIGIMGGAIELAKLCATTFIYRYWKKTKIILRLYFCISIFTLIVITSMGIFGYLSAAYQQSSSSFKDEQEKISMVENSKGYLTDKISQSKSRIDILNTVRQLQEGRLSSTLTNDFLTRNPIQLRLLQEQTTDLIKTSDENIRTEQMSIQSSTSNMYVLNDQIMKIKTGENSKKDIKTFQFVADQFGVSLDSVAKCFIFVIVIIFDPLAIALILAYNIASHPISPRVDPINQNKPTIDTVTTPATPLVDSISTAPNSPIAAPSAPPPDDSPKLPSHILADISRMFKL